MSLAELMPAVQGLSREEKAELVRRVTDDWRRRMPCGVRAGRGYDTGPGLHDAHEAAAILYKEWQDRRGGA